MRTTMKKLILASLLFATALLFAGSAYAAALYFPHIATSIPWQTEIAIINISDQTVNGTLRALNDKGQLVETRDVTLSAQGRRQITVADEFISHTKIGYITFDADSSAVQGYTKFYWQGYYRVAIPAVKQVNISDIYIPHIASNADWWTGISLLNTTSVAKELTITFNTGLALPYMLSAHEHKAFNIASLFNNQPQPDIQSAVIANASGIIGLELFGSIGSGNQLDGILLTDKTASTIYYPHVAGDEWWTGIVAYNPSELACTATITPYSAQGTLLTSSTLSIPGKGKYVGAVSGLGLPAQTAWLKIDSNRPITGFELFGTVDGNQLAAYAGRGGADLKAGVFAKIEKNGWTGIAFVNSEANAASVTLTAYNDAGTAVATQVLPVDGHAKVVDVPEAIFSQDISGATYIAYSSDRSVVGFQLNGSSDDMMLDALPALAGTVVAPIDAKMVLIPYGSFVMGDIADGGGDNYIINARNLHIVTLSAFYMEKYEVTKALWDEIYNWATGRGYTFDLGAVGSGANHPAEGVSWYDTVKWLNARSEMEGRVPVYYTDSSQQTVYRTGQVSVAAGAVKWSANGYRLPTEAEWEYAARGGTTTRYYTGDCISSATQANFEHYPDPVNPNKEYDEFGCPFDGGREGTTVVGSFPANPFGLYDMAGNVSEWTWDWHAYYSFSDVTNPRGPDEGSRRVDRGGGWYSHGPSVRSASRDTISPEQAYLGLGFRSAMSVVAPPDNPYPRITAFGVYSRDFRIIDGVIMGCTLNPVADNAVIDLRQLGCKTGVFGPDLSRYLSKIEIENPAAETLSYDWTYTAYYPNLVFPPLTLTTRTATPSYDMIGGLFGARDTPYMCTLDVRVNAPDPLRTKSQRVWSGQCINVEAVPH